MLRDHTLYVLLLAPVLAACSTERDDAGFSGVGSVDDTAATDETDSSPDESSTGSDGPVTTNTTGAGDDETGGSDGPGSDDTGEPTGDDPEDGPIALFAINEGNFNGDMDAGIWSIMTGCSGPSFDAYMAKVAEFPELDDAKHFVTGWSCGATYALIRGFEHADVFRGIVHINQASAPGYADTLDQAFQNGGNVKVPVFVIHDFGYDAGGSYTISWLESKGYQMGVDLFVMDRPGTGHDPHLTDDEKAVVAAWFRDI